MPLIVPITSSTFGDSSVTMGDPLGRKYVLAQFRVDANFDWVRETRSRLVRDELKYRDIHEHEARLRQDRLLWSRIENGVGQASIIVIDSDRIRSGVLEQALHDGADLFDIDAHYDDLVDQCATAIVGNTPIAYLPLSLMRVFPWRQTELISSFDRFTPEHIRKKIGGGLKQAQVFAARAHAVFDLANNDSSATRTDDIFQSPAARVMLAELLATSRTFDAESPGTLPLLNEAAEEISKSMSSFLNRSNWDEQVDTLEDSTTDIIPDTPANPKGGATILVNESDSRARDELQAADVAAGWARHLLDRGGERSLATKFERVWVNGRRWR